MSNSNFRPSRAILRVIVNLDQKWGRNEQRSVRSEHLKHIAYCTIRPKQMLEHLLGEGAGALCSVQMDQSGGPGFLHMTMLEPLATNNPRALPQQSISSGTNIDDLEGYLSRGEKFLRAIDLPVSERQVVMQELALMGITAGSLFPGLDGACLQLKERYFDL